MNTKDKEITLGNKYSVRSTAKSKYRKKQNIESQTQKERTQDRKSLQYAYVSAQRTNRPLSRWESADKIKKRYAL